MSQSWETLTTLSFDKPEYKSLFLRGLACLGQRNKEIFEELLQACLGPDGPYLGKVVLGARPFAVHLFEPSFPDNVVAWLCPKRDYVNIRLYMGTHLGDVMNLITNPGMTGTPHPVNVQIRTEADIPAGLAYIRDSARRRNFQ